MSRSHIALDDDLEEERMSEEEARELLKKWDRLRTEKSEDWEANKEERSI